MSIEIDIEAVIEKSKHPNIVLLVPKPASAKALKNKLLLKTDDVAGRTFHLNGKTLSVISLTEDLFSEIADYSIMYVDWFNNAHTLRVFTEQMKGRLKQWESQAKQIISV